jgi:acyl-CoA synthetase (AMP-forming)/AMP-acid ligase II
LLATTISLLKIADVYVVGVPDKRMGEELCACIKLKAGESALSVQDIREFCKDRVHFGILLLIVLRLM